MEKVDNVAVVPADLDYSDVGTWSALHELYPADAGGKVILGRAQDVGSRDSLIFTQDCLENPSTKPLALIEVQTGNYLEEDDIVRLADDLWRVKEKA
jgi:mannose-1-phosphate guanylyltransferase